MKFTITKTIELKDNPPRNLICIEGGELVGKTSLSIDLFDHFKDRKVHVASNPGYTEVGKQLRAIAKSSGLSPEAYKAIFTACEIDIFDKFNRLGLDKEYNKDLFIMDRFWMSSIIYQCIIPKGIPYDDILTFSEKGYPLISKLSNFDNIGNAIYDIVYTLFTKFSNRQIEPTSKIILLIAKDNKTLVNRINRELDFHERYGVDKINNLYKILPSLLYEIYFLLRYELQSEKGLEWLLYLINSIYVIYIDNKSREEILKEALIIIEKD